MAEPLKLATRADRGNTESVELIGRSAIVSRVKEFVRRAASLDAFVLITGEAGCAVDSVARELHARSGAASGPFVHVECGSGDPGRLERALFGLPPDGVVSDLETAASDSRIVGARGGVLFLQDVVDLPASVQARLARVTRDGQVRVDGRIVETSVRFIASAPVSVDAEVEGHRFRADLHRRLSAIRIDLPPLRDRLEDVPAVATRLLADLCAARGLSPRTFTHASLALIGALTWPGNIKELRDALDRVLVESRAEAVQVEDLLPALRLQRTSAAFAPAGSLREARTRFEREYIASVLQHHDWHMADAAQTLGIQRPNLYRKARQLGIPLTRAVE